MAGLLNNSNMETGGTEEEAEEGIEAALGMEVGGEGDGGGASQGKEEGDGNPRALGFIESLLSIQSRAELRLLMTVMVSKI